MSVRDQIATLEARGDLNLEDRQAQRRVLKRDAWLSAAQDVLPHTFTQGAIEVTIRSVRAMGEHVSIRVTVKRNGVTLPLDPHHVIVNPPMMVDDPAGDVVVSDADGKELRRMTEAPMRALKAVLADTIRQQILALR